MTPNQPGSIASAATTNFSPAPIIPVNNPTVLDEATTQQLHTQVGQPVLIRAALVVYDSWLLHFCQQVLCGEWNPVNLILLQTVPIKRDASPTLSLSPRRLFGVFRGRVSPENNRTVQQLKQIKHFKKTQKGLWSGKRQLPETRRQVSHFLSRQPAADKCFNCCLFSVAWLFPKAQDEDFVLSTVKEARKYFTFKKLESIKHHQMNQWRSADKQ